jgi:hypothetical protein
MHCQSIACISHRNRSIYTEKAYMHCLLHALAINTVVHKLREHVEPIMHNLAYHARYLVRACKILYSIGPSHDESSLERPVFLDPLVSMVKRVCVFIHHTSYEQFTKE